MKLYYTSGNSNFVSESVLLSALPRDRRLQIERRPYPDRIVSAAATLLLRYALCDTGNRAFCDVPIIREGKPHFADPIIPLYFNLSHTTDKASGDFAAAVLLSENGEVGVDLEFVRTIRNRERLIQRLFTAQEREYLGKSGDESAFFDIWCAKEAFVKWMGEGFARPLSSVSVDVAGRCAVSDAIVCDLAWYTIGQSRICCAADDLSSGIEIRVVSPNEFTKYQEE